MYGPMWPFYACIGLMIRDTGIPQVDDDQRDTLGFRASQLGTRVRMVVRRGRINLLLVSRKRQKTSASHEFQDQG